MGFEEANEATKALKVRLAAITAAGDDYDDQIDQHYRRLNEIRGLDWQGRYGEAVAVVEKIGAEIEPLERQLFGGSQ